MNKNKSTLKEFLEVFSTAMPLIVGLLGAILAIFSFNDKFSMLRDEFSFLMPIFFSFILIIPAEMFILMRLKKNRKQVYVDYPTDSEFAKKLIARLKQRSSFRIRSALDLHIGDNVLETINEWLSSSDAIIIILSSNSEYNKKLWEQQSELIEKKIIIPIVPKNATQDSIPSNIAKLKYAIYDDNDTDENSTIIQIVDEIVKSLRYSNRKNTK